MGSPILNRHGHTRDVPRTDPPRSGIKKKVRGSRERIEIFAPYCQQQNPMSLISDCPEPRRTNLSRQMRIVAGQKKVRDTPTKNIEPGARGVQRRRSVREDHEDTVGSQPGSQEFEKELRRDVR